MLAVFDLVFFASAKLKSELSALLSASGSRRDGVGMWRSDVEGKSSVCFDVNFEYEDAYQATLLYYLICIMFLSISKLYLFACKVLRGGNMTGIILLPFVGCAV